MGVKWIKKDTYTYKGKTYHSYNDMYKDVEADYNAQNKSTSNQSSNALSGNAFSTRLLAPKITSSPFSNNASKSDPAAVKLLNDRAREDLKSRTSGGSAPSSFSSTRNISPIKTTTAQTPTYKSNIPDFLLRKEPTAADYEKDVVRLEGEITQIDKDLSQLRGGGVAPEQSNLNEYNEKLNTLYSKRSELNSTKAKMNVAKYREAGASLSTEIKKDSKYNEYVAKGEALGNEKADGWFVPDTQRKNTVAYLRNNPEAMKMYEDALDNTNGLVKRTMLEGNAEYKLAKYGTQEQVETYYAYLGKGDTENAEKYLKYVEESLNIAMGNEIAESKDSVLGKLAFGVTAGTDQFQQGMTNIVKGVSGDDYIPASPTQVASSKVRESLKYKGPEFLGASLGQGAYDFITTTSNMAPSIGASFLANAIVPGSGAVVGSSLMGGSAAGNSYQEKLNAGWTKGQAATYATIVGVSEAGLQYAMGGVGSLGGKITGTSAQAVARGIDNAALRFATTYGMKMASEGMEEALQEVLNPFFENLALGYKKNSWSDIEWEQVAYSGMLGALSAGFLEGGSTAVNVFGENNSANKYGKHLKDGGYATRILEIAATSEKGSETKGLYETYTKKGVNADNITDLQLGRLFVNAEADARSALSNAKNKPGQFDSALSTILELDAMKPSASIEAVEQVSKTSETTPDAPTVTSKPSEATSVAETLEQAAREVVEGRKKNDTTSPVQMVEELSKNGQKITVEEAKEASGYGDNGAKVLADFVNNTEGKSFSQVKSDMHLYYEAGLTNKANVKLENNLQQEAYLAGKTDREVSRIKATEGIFKNRVFSREESGLITPESKNKGNLNPAAVPKTVSRKMVKALDVVGKALGRKVMFVDSITVNGKEDAANAQVRSDGVFEISVKAEQPLYELLFHEPLHIMRQENTAEYHAFVDFAVQHAEYLDLRLDAGDSRGTKFEGNIAQYQEYDLSIGYDANIEEIAAHFAEKLSRGDRDAIRLIEKMSQNTETRTALQRFFDVLKDVIDKCVELWNRLKKQGEYAAAEELGITISELKKAKELYAKALTATAENAQQRVSEQKAEKSSESLENQGNKEYNGSTSYALKKSEQYGVMWTLEKGVLDNNEVSAFYEKISETKNNKYHNYHKASDGQLIYEIGNKLVYTDGDYNYPHILKVIAFNTNDAYLLEYGKESIYDGEKHGDTSSTIIEVVEAVLGEGTVETTTYSSYEADKRSGKSGEKGTDSTEANRRSQKDVSDSTYLELAKEPEKNEAKLREMVKQRAEESGFPAEVFHGTLGFGFTKADVSYSDDGISFFATDSLETAGTYSGVDESTTIGKKIDMDDAVDKFETSYDDAVSSLISQVNSVAGEYNFMSYSDRRFDEFRRTILEGTDSFDNVCSDLDEYIDEIVEMLYDNAMYDSEGFEADGFYESNDIQNIYENAKTLHSLLKDIEDVLNKEVGNYHLYANTDGLFEIDAKGKRWNNIPFDEYDTSGLTPVVNTRQLAHYAKSEGYKGVKISNVFDDGGRNLKHQTKPATVYIFFNPQEQVKSADLVTYDDAGGIIPLSKRFDKSNNDIRFSLKKTVEETKDLIAVHNMQVSELERTLDLGGLPMPSIAIIKAQNGHSEYGDVSLVFDKSVIDPKASKLNKVYGGDAWTPTYPTIEYKPNSKIAKKISDKYYKLSRKYGYDETRPLYGYVYDLERVLNNNKGEAELLNELYEDTQMMQLYLLDSGKDKVEAVQKETRTELTDAEVEMREFFLNELEADVIDEVYHKGDGPTFGYAKTYLSKHGDAIEDAYKKLLSEVYQFSDEQVQNVLDSTKGNDYIRFVRDAYKYRKEGKVTIKTEVDSNATQQAIKEAAGEDYRKWVDYLFKGVEEKSGIRNNADYFTNSGNRRSWEALHWENNLENVVKVMKGQTDVGGSGIFAGHNIWGVAAKNYGSIKEIKADSDRLQRIPEEEYNKIKEGFGQRLSEIAHSIMDKTESNYFIASDNAMECIVEAVRNSRTKSGILSNLKEYPQLTVTETTADDIVSLVNDISNMPTEYFEAKPKRAVMLNEIATAIIPDNASEELKSKLAENNIQFVEYEATNEDARLEALNSLEGSKFSLKRDTNLSNKDTKELLDIIGHLKNEFEVTKFAKADPKKLAKMTKDILKEYSSQADLDATTKAIDELYQYLANGEDGHPAAWNEVYSKAYEIADRIVEGAVAVDNDIATYYKSLRDYLRNTRMKFDSRYDSVPSGYDNFLDFRRHNWGRLNFTKDGTSIDKVYQELCDLFPNDFKENEATNAADQLDKIVTTLDKLKEVVEYNPYEKEHQQYASFLANDIIDRFFDVPQAKPTFADKAERRVVEARIAGGKKVEAVRLQKDEKIQKLIDKQRAKTKKLIENAKTKKAEAVNKEKAKREKAISNMKESQKAKVLRAQIMRHANDLSQKLVRPTDNKHIPEDLKGVVAKVLESINLESNYTYDPETRTYKKSNDGLPTRRTKAFEELRKLYSEIASSVVVDPDLLGDNGLLSDVILLADKRVVDMNSTELETVWKTICAVEASISTANKMFSAGKYETIFDVAEKLWNDNNGKKGKYYGPIRKGLNVDMLTPETFLHYLGDAGDSMFRMMRDAQDKHISIMKEVADFTHKTLKDVNVNSLEKTIHTVTLGGEEVQLSTAQLMELYVLVKREQAIDHIFKGGILPDVIAKKKKLTRAEPIRNISMGEITEALSNLTDDQKKIADKLQRYVSSVLSEYGNEASMQVYNYRKFNEQNYWTIRTNKQEIQSEIGKDTTVTSVANKGMTKATKPHANTSVRIGSIFDTFSSHSSDMATYAAWLGTSEDINRIRNFVFWNDNARVGTVKGILDTVHGTKGSAYLEKLLTDIAIGVQGVDSMNPFDKFAGTYKAASVGANIRVIIQQPTAILRAMDMVGAQHLTAGAYRPLKGWEKAKKYAPIAQWKDWGYFDINTGRQMKDILFENASVLEKTKQAGMWGASMADSLAWGQLWNAVELETKAKQKGLEVGSEEFYEAVAKRFTEIVDHTQVVDGIMQRSQFMRSADGVAKMATSFMGEPTKQYNMAISAAHDAKNSKGEARKNAYAKLGRTAMSLAVAGIVNAAAQSIIDAMRDDDKEEKYWEKWLHAFVGNEDDKWFQKFGNLGDTFNPLTYVPYAKDVLSVVQGYDVKRMDMESISKMWSATENLYKAITKTGKYTLAEAAASFFAELGRLYGVPVANVKRDIKSAVMTYAIETDNYLMQYRMEKAMLDINYSYNNKNFVDILFNAYNNDSEAYEIIYKDMLKSGYDTKKIKDGMETRMKKAEGVKEAPELEKRYMTPETEKKYDNSLKRIQSSQVWKSASPAQRKEAEADLHSFLTSDSKDMEKLRAEARASGVDETEYTLWQLAIEMADQPDGQKGSGSYDLKEKAEAINSLDLGDREIAYFFGKGLNETSKEEIDETLNAGIDLKEYVNFKAATSDMKADKNAKGNSIPNSKKKKVVNYLNNAGLTDEEWDYFYYEIMNYKK